MRVYVAELGAIEIDAPAKSFGRLAEESSPRVHCSVTDPADADIILFTQVHMLRRDWRLSAIQQHPLCRKYPQKVLVYDERDRPWCALPGVYVSMPAHSFKPGLQRACAYYRVPRYDTPSVMPDLLFSLVASPSASCRRPLFALRHENAIVEKVDRFTFYDPGSRDFAKRKARFQEVVARSRFVLCPRGRGTSSIRLYEALAAGRVPVIISDDWVPPSGPRWEDFSIRWPEHRTSGLIETMLELDPEWPAMSTRAFEAYRRFFSEDASFRYIVDQCEELQRSCDGRRGSHRPIRNRAFFEAGFDIYRSQVVTSARRTGKRALNRLSIGLERDGTGAQ